MNQHLADPLLSAPSYVEVLRGRARLQPDQWAYTFDADGERRETRLSFDALDRRARALGARLQGLGLSGERALLLYPPGLDFIAAFFGCLYAGAVAVPAYLPKANRPMTRLRAIVAGARPGAVLTTSAQLSDGDAWAAQVPELAGLPHLATDEVPDSLADGWIDPGATRETLAFLQYTSGSTSEPKGVMVTHGNLLHNSALIRRCFESDPESRGVFWLPLHHDMGLIGGVLQTLYCGGSSTLLSPVAFLQRPLRWLQAVSRTGATISGGPNFAYDLCARKVAPEQAAELDLSRWSVAFNGAEPIRPETLDRFAEVFAPSGFRREAFLPCYGLAEATLLVSGGPKSAGPVVFAARADAFGRDEAAPAGPDDPQVRTLVGDGQLPPDQTVAIVDPATSVRLPEDRVGEIWVAGPSVAKGYWGQPEATEATFRAMPAETGEGPFLRTGDLGFLRGGELFVTGRLKDLIIVRGRNVYPQDVEWTVERCHPALRPEGGAAFSVESDGEERLVIVHEIERQAKNADSEPIVRAIRQAVAEQHELDVHAVCLLKPATLPRTTSGKVRRHACRDGFLAGSLETVATSVRNVPTEPNLSLPRSEGDSGEDPRPSARVIEDWLASRLAGPLGVASTAVDIRKPFASFGMGSLQAVGLAGALQDWLGRSLSPTLLYEYPTIESLARHLAGIADETAPLSPEDPAPTTVDEPIAIIGIGCRFPGASGPEAFWDLLREGVEAVGPVPADRWDADAFPGPDPNAPGPRNPRRGGFLEQVDRFDADFFGISPREAARTDPQQRLLLEVAWEALEDAGQVPERLAGAAVGVFVGISTNDYGRLQRDDADGGDAYAVTGNAASIAANRLSYLFDFRGPSLAIDTACSSSLVAIQMACRSLRGGEASLAMAGGVNLVLSPEVSASFTKAGFLAPDGRCKAFDARANGYARGEGAGLVVLKPLAKALADGDPVYALILGGAVNQDGRTNGLTAPSRQAQEDVLRAAYRAAGRPSGAVQYVEAHGTGTLLGDPIEAAALGAVLADGRPADRPCALGSVKTNIGHLEAAAGVAGLIKVALALKHRAIPASLHFLVPNPHIPFGSLPLRIQTRLEDWPATDGPALAGVSSFGFGGTNAHLVLEEAPAPVGRPHPSNGGPSGATGCPQPVSPQPPQSRVPKTEPVALSDAFLLPFSARSPEALQALARSYAELLSTTGPADSIADVAFTAGARRGHHEHRLAVVARSRGEAAEHLKAFLRGEARPEVRSGRKGAGRRPGLAFVFSGQGSQWPGMGRALLEREPVFRAAIEACDRHFVPLAGWSLAADLSAGEAGGRLAGTEGAQPLIFAVQVGLLALWRSWGIVPDAVAGHSVGEVAAAHAAGALELADAVRVVFHRARLMQAASGRGKTAAIGLSPDEAKALVAADPRLALAAINGPGSTTISGEPEAVREAVDSLRARGVFARLLDVDCAFHGPQMDPSRRDLETALTGLRPRPASIPIVSTVTGQPIDGKELDAAYWGRNVREPVLFADAVGALVAGGAEVFVEVGPHPVLAGPVSECLRQLGRDAIVLASSRRGDDGRDGLLRSLGALYASGFAVDWDRVSPPGRCVRLPSYPWQRERHWFEPRQAHHNGNGHSAVSYHLPNGNGNGHHNGNGKNGHHHADEPAAADSELAGCLFELQWQPRERAGTAPSPNGRRGRWLIFEDAGGVGRALRSSLEGRGMECVAVPADGPLDLSDPEAFTRVVAAALGDGETPCLGVVHLWGLDVIEGPDDLDSARVRGLGSALHLVQALAKVGGRAGPRLWLVTRGAQPAGPEPGPLAVSQAPLWGLGRSITLEHPELWGGLIDLDPAASDPVCAGAVAETILGPDGEDQVAFRGGRRYVARLVRSDAAASRPGELSMRPEGTYLVTGGLGDLGLRSARWLAGRGARRIVLIGRRALPGRGAWDQIAEGHPDHARVAAIREIEQMGATVMVASGDVADPVRMAALFEHLRDTLPPIRGILHASGVVSTSPTRDADLDTLAEVLRPKAAGAVVLHGLARDLPLDFFVLFSSIASILGAKESPYAAANQFLDAFAHDLRARGIPALSVNWGPWEGVGMASAPDRARAFRLLGLEPLSADRGFRALEALIGSGARQASVVEADWFTLKFLHGQEGSRRLLDAIEDEPRARPAPERNGDLADWRDDPPDRRRARLVRYFRDRVAGVLRLEPDRLDPERPLNTLGLDSLMAIELKGGVEADLGAALPLASLLQGPTIEQLADAVLAQAPAPTAMALAPAREPGTAEHPLSLGQQSLWYLHQLEPDASTYNLAGAARIRGRLDVEVLRRSLQQLVDRHASLRTTFPATTDGRPLQRVHERSEVSLAVEDASDWPEAEAAHRLSDEAHRPFDLQSGPLLRAHLLRRSADEHDLLLSMHHVASDFWSVATLMHELARVYPALHEGRAADLAPIGLEYADYARWQAEMLEGPEGERLWAYWRDKLRGPLPMLDLPTDRPRPAVRTERGDVRTTRLGAGLARELGRLGDAHGASLYVTLLAAFQTFLARQCGQDDLIVGSPVAGRNRPGLAGVVGYFVNPLPIRSDLSGDPSFTELLLRTRGTVLEGLEHQEFPFPLMVDRLQPARDPSRSPLFQVMFVFQQAQRLGKEGLAPFALRSAGPRMDLGTFSLESIALERRTTQYDLTLMAAEESDGRLAVSLEFNTDLFDGDTIERMLDRFETLIAGIVERPEAKLSALPLLPEAERRRVLAEWNATDADFPRSACIHQLIETRAARTPDAIAVVVEDRELTYRDLDDRANRLAHHLSGLGVGPGALVAVALERSAEMVVALLGTLKAGAAYVPIDPEYPAERIAYMLDDARADVVLTQSRLRDLVPVGRARVVCLDDDWPAIEREPGRAPVIAVTPDDLAYVIYTSGSTGRPKGVMVSHRNLVHSTHARSLYYGEPVGGFLLLSSIAFDSSVAGLFWTLRDGGRLVLPPGGVTGDPALLARWVDEHEVTHLLCVPSLFAMVLSEAPAGTLAGLRVAIVAGEPCPAALVAEHHARLPRAYLYNEYGPTEATVWSSVHRCEPEADGSTGPVPIGRPIANTRTLILDARMQPAPIGVPGELYIGGEGVARGYLDRPGLTAERFLPDPFGGWPGSRLYKTGDLARWRADGTIEFLGRADDQVKIRGHRIELGEVEAALRRHPAVREASASAFEDATGHSRLVAYVVPRADEVPIPADLKRWLRERLPESMVPSAIVTLEALPLGPNGKVDRRALPAPGPAGPDREAGFVAPRDSVEETLARITAGVLGLDAARVGVHDNLFELGIDSIRSIQVVSRARQAGLRLDPAHLFRHPTIAELALVAGPTGSEEPEEAEPEAVGPATDEAGVEAIYSLSPVQEGMLFHTLYAPESGVYVQQFTCLLRGELHLPAFEEAWRRVIERHPVLRTAIQWVDSDRPMQVVYREAQLPMESHDWRDAGPAGQEDRLTAYLRDDRRRGFVPTWAPLLRLALFRTADDAHQLAWSNHHLLMDGWCLPIVLGEVLALYEAIREGREAVLPPARPYRDYINWLGRLDLAEAESYWRRTLQGFRAPTPLGVDRPLATNGAPGAESHAERSARLPADSTAALGALARAHALTLNTVVQGAWALLLARYSGRDDVVFGVTVSGRPAGLPGVETMVGLFINTLPLRVAVSEDAPLLPWLADLQSRLVELRRHESSPLVQVHDWSEVPRGIPLFESIFVFENYPLDAAILERAGRLGIEEIRALERTNYPLTIMAIPGVEFRLRVDYDTRRFGPAAIDLLLGHLRTLLEAIADDPARRLADVPMLTDAERLQVLGQGSNLPDVSSLAAYRNGDAGHDAEGLDRISDEELDSLLHRLLTSEEVSDE